MRSLHHSKVFVKKIKNDDKILVDYTYENGEHDEKFVLECGDAPHADFFEAWKGAREQFREQLGLGEDRILNLRQVTIDADEMLVKGDLELALEDYAKPVKISTPKLEIQWDIIENLSEQAAKYVTREKRAQTDLFNESSDDEIDAFDRSLAERRRESESVMEEAQEFRNEVVGFQ